MNTTLTYFDFDGSRGLECRLALAIAGVAFEDNRINHEQWRELKPKTPFGALPALRVGERQIVQCNAILRYVGNGNGMHPTDAWTAARHDSLMDSVEDVRHKVPGKGLNAEEKKAARQEFASGWLTQWATSVEGEIQGPYIEGAHLNVADIKVYVILRSLYGGVWDDVDPAKFTGFAKLKALHDAVDAHPAVRAWFA